MFASHLSLLLLTLSTCGCQYSSCVVLAPVLFILEKNVGLVRYMAEELIPNTWAILCWILCLTSLQRSHTAHSAQSVTLLSCCFCSSVSHWSSSWETMGNIPISYFPLRRKQRERERKERLPESIKCNYSFCELRASNKPAQEFIATNPRAADSLAPAPARNKSINPLPSSQATVLT